MYLRVGGFLRPFNEARATITYRPQYDGRRVILAVEHIWEITGRIVLKENATQRRMSQAINILARDFRQYRPDLVFVEDNGVTETPLQLRRANCIEGPESISTSFPMDNQDVYSTGVGYSVTMRALVSVPSTANPIINFQESLTADGGGQLHGYVGGAINFAERQMFMQRQPFTGVQQGSATGLYGYPTVPRPIWPQALIKLPTITPVSPRIAGPIAREFTVTWRYDFQWHTRLSGFPHTFTS